MENKHTPHSEILNFANYVAYADNSIVSKIIMQRPEGNVTLFSFDKGQFLSEHTAPFDALIQIIEGKAEVSINKVKYFLAQGESIIMPANIPHAVHAPEKFKMLLTMIKSK